MATDTVMSGRGLNASPNEALYRFSGMYGEAWRNGAFLGDVVEVSGAVEIARIDVPLVGLIKTGYKPGRETREGTFRIQKMDTAWEMEIYQFLSGRGHKVGQQTDRSKRTDRSFQLLLRFNDPDALGDEALALSGVLLWRMPVGFSIGDDITEREFPMTWTAETYITAFKRQGDTPHYYEGMGPTGGGGDGGGGGTSIGTGGAVPA